jgi:putative ABC transport system permease protein
MPILVVAIGVTLVVLMHCWVTGVLGDMIVFNARFATGHVKVMSKAYSENIDQTPNDLALLGTAEVLQNLKTDYPGMEWVERIQFGGLLDSPDENGETKAQGPGGGMAVDLLSPDSREAERLNLLSSLVRGRMIQSTEEVLLSDEFASKLEVEPGDQVTLISTTMFGAMSITNFTVCGTVNFGSTALDRGGMVADINSIRTALDMQDATGEILGYLPNEEYDELQAEAISAAFTEKYNDPEDEFSPVMLSLRDQGTMTMYLDMVDYFKSVIIGIFLIAMAIVLWNSGLLGGLRRYGEMGLRIAIGEEKRHIYRSLITESIFIGLMGSIVGTAFGLFFASLLTKGIDIGGMMGNSNMMMQSVMKARITTDAYYIGFIPGVLATAIGTALAGIGIFKRETSQLFKELQA